ncbi:unnamed protein product [Vitrella brassicaformis CCMP3155]|uniref:Uncharacterized protein n=1 Tax=Vitrella brassicaformis (strain CCMP3155) TaxID=1169540 RepID=A0A0G4G9H6_VITBC|nr:unnamed protein product [Vitrella brassicaformis CCMP3155]|eukprot:CEM25448.1 unnamed protein product [Vitrella brassicaformis CCMP3155]
MRAIPYVGVVAAELVVVAGCGHTFWSSFCQVSFLLNVVGRVDCLVRYEATLKMRELERIERALRALKRHNRRHRRRHNRQMHAIHGNIREIYAQQVSGNGPFATLALLD